MVMQEKTDRSILRLSLNENPLGPSPKAVEAMTEAISHANLYSYDLADKVVEKLADQMDIPRDHIILTAGGEELIRLFCQAFLKNGDEVVLSALCFPPHRNRAKQQGCMIRSVPVRSDFSDDPEGFLQKITPKTKAVFLTNPSNPTGLIMTRREMSELMSRIPENVLVMMDEAYYDYAREDHDYPDSLSYVRKRHNVVVLRTLSKICGLAGMRVGYGVSDPALIREMMRYKSRFNVNIAAQAGALAAISDTPYIRRTIRENRLSVGLMERYFADHGYYYLKTRSNFVFVDLKQNADRICADLLKRGAAIQSGVQWGYDSFVRISSTTEEKTKKFLDILDQYLNTAGGRK